MSDVSQGPGWWVASDGKWYAPELHPDAQRVATREPLPLLPKVPIGNVNQAPGWSTAIVGQSFRREETVTSPGQSAPSTFYGGTTSSGKTPSQVAQRVRVGRFPSLLVILALVVVVGGSALGFVLSQGSGSAIVNDTPDQIVPLATAAVRSSGSVHVVTVAQTQDGPVTWVGDVGTNSGEQTIDAGSMQAKAIVVNGVTYFNANLEAMTKLLGVPAGVADRAAGKWLSLSPSDAASSQVGATLTVNSLLSQVTPHSPLTTLGQSMVNAQQVVGISGKLQGGLSATLYVSATGQPLPIQEIADTGNYNTTTTFSNWGEAVHPAPPSGAIPASTLGL